MANNDDTGIVFLHSNKHFKEGTKRPTNNGKGFIPRGFLERIVNKMRETPEGEDVELEVSGWPATDKNGNEYLQVKLDLVNPKYATGGGRKSEAAAPASDGLDWE